MLIGGVKSVAFKGGEFPFVDSMVEHFMRMLFRATIHHISVSSSRLYRLPVPWWTDRCQDSIHAWKRPLHYCQAHLTEENLIAFRRLCAKALCIIRETKHMSWWAFVCRLSWSAHSNVMWNKLKHLSGK